MQDRAIANIGRIYLSKLGFNSPFELYTQNMFPGENYKMILITFALTDSEAGISCTFKDIDIEIASEKNYLKYAYRKGSANGGDITFTTKFSGDEKKLKTIVHKQFPNILNKINSQDYPKEFEILKAVEASLSENYSRILSELNELYSNLDRTEKTKTGLSFLFRFSEETKYIGDFEIFKNAVSYSGTEGKAVKYETTSKGENSICSVCLKERPELHGFASPFKFYTVDKRGFASNFFKRECSWKNYPICPECGTLLEFGKKYIENNFKRYFYGKSYYLIPKLIVEDQTELEKVLHMINKYNDSSYGQTEKKIEDTFFEYISKKENYFNLDLLFFEEDATTKAIKIKLMIEEIFPSRFKKIFSEIPCLVNENIIYKEIFKNKNNEYDDLRFNFGILKKYFENSFYDIIYRIFTGEKISASMVYDSIMNVIRKNYKEKISGNKNWGILEAVMALEYFHKLGIIETDKNYKYEVQMEQINETKSSYDIEKLNKFIVENKGLFDCDYKAGLFSLGMLVRVVLDIQNVNLNNTPFEKALRGLNLNYEILTRVYTEAIAKISQYMNFYAYGNLKEFVNEYFVKTSYQLKTVPNSEISFYFTAGLEMGNKFKNKKENN